jgi:hypothetical protein
LPNEARKIISMTGQLILERGQWRGIRQELAAGVNQNDCPLSGAKRTWTVMWLRPPRSRMTQLGHERVAFAAMHGHDLL